MEVKLVLWVASLFNLVVCFICWFKKMDWLCCKHNLCN